MSGIFKADDIRAADLWKNNRRMKGRLLSAGHPEYNAKRGRDLAVVAERRIT
jgi:hypothetical protein